MCTVSYIPTKKVGGFILTSNRDEKSVRPTLPPAVYNVNGVELCFPKDIQAGGSWIASNNKGRLCCLLNGAFVAHKKEEWHTESRGKVLIDLSSSLTDAKEYFERRDLSKVEPFTIITADRGSEKVVNLSEFIWDGKHKRFRKLDVAKSYIWSSVTLYTNENVLARKQWFSKFLVDYGASLNSEEILSFHSGKHSNDNSVNLVMERPLGLKTVSITQVTSEKLGYQMNYFDLLKNQKYRCNL